MKDQLDAIGFDFGTTNSSVALLDDDSEVHFASFLSLGAQVESFRSVLYLEQFRTGIGHRRTHVLTGHAAIERYLQAEEKGRLVQSLKSHLSSGSLTGTEVFGRRYKLEDLIARMLGDLRKHSAAQFERPLRYAMVGRQFASSARKHRKMTTLPFRGCERHLRLRVLNAWTLRWSRSRPPAPMKLRLTTTN